MTQQTPSLLDVVRFFLNFLNAIGIWNEIILIAVFGYCCLYGISLRNAARNDARNYGQLQTMRYVHLIFWERLRKGDFLTVLYVACAALGPVLGAVMLLNTLKR